MPGGLPSRALSMAIPATSDRRQGKQGRLYLSRWPVANLLGVRLSHFTGGGDREPVAMPAVSMLLPGIPLASSLSPLLPPHMDGYLITTYSKYMDSKKQWVNRVAVNLRVGKLLAGLSPRKISPVPA